MQMEVIWGSFHGEEVRNIIKKPANCFIFAFSWQKQLKKGINMTESALDHLADAQTHYYQS